MKRMIFLSFLGLVLGTVAMAAQENGDPFSSVELHFFWAAGCPNCEVMHAFLDELATDYPDLNVVAHEVAFHPDEWRLMMSLAESYGIDGEETPMVFVGRLGTSGIGRATELLIKEEVERCLAQGCSSPLERLEKVGWRPSPLEVSIVALVTLAILYFLVVRPA
jgi:thiol-disulfide isomerase/thioredoxin